MILQVLVFSGQHQQLVLKYLVAKYHVELYLEKPLVDLTDKFEVLEFWKKLMDKLPEIFAILISTLPSDCSFGIEIEKRQLSLEVLSIQRQFKLLYVLTIVYGLMFFHMTSYCVFFCNYF